MSSGAGACSASEAMATAAPTTYRASTQKATLDGARDLAAGSATAAVLSALHTAPLLVDLRKAAGHRLRRVLLSGHGQSGLDHRRGVALHHPHQQLAQGSDMSRR